MFGCQKCLKLRIDTENSEKVYAKSCGHQTSTQNFEYCVECAIEKRKCQKCGSDMNGEDLVSNLGGKVVDGDRTRFDMANNTLTLVFTDNTKVVAARRSGPGNGEWEIYTQISINGRDILNK